MGEAKRKQYSKQQFLREHTHCIYCGQPAVTTDHCPPRSFFEARQWPEGYEFPACNACNQESRLDEQVLAVLARLRLNGTSEAAHEEWTKLLSGVANNQPEYLAEWRDVSPSRSKRELRKAFGEAGDRMRWAGAGLIKIGPLSRAAIRRFCAKLGRALYYRHLGEIFEGEISIRHIDPIMKNKDLDQLRPVFELARQLVRPVRNSRSLEDQFIYRLDYSKELSALYAVVQFGPQMVFQIMVLGNDVAQQVNEGLLKEGITPATGAVFRCSLANPS